MRSFECIKNEKSVYFLLTSAEPLYLGIVFGKCIFLFSIFTFGHADICNKKEYYNKCLTKIK